MGVQQFLRNDLRRHSLVCLLLLREKTLCKAPFAKHTHFLIHFIILLPINLHKLLHNVLSQRIHYLWPFVIFLTGSGGKDGFVVISWFFGGFDHLFYRIRNSKS